MFRRFLKLAIVMSDFMSKVYNSGFTAKFSVSMLKEIIVVVSDYIYETWK